MRLYLVTDRHATNGRPLTDVVEDALRGGVDAVQLREKDLSTRDLLALARELRALTNRYRAKLLINDRIDVALAVAADGVHLPATSFAVADARRLLGADAIIGVSTHAIEEVARAAAAGADFAVFGPIFDTPSKRSFGAPHGLDALRRAVAAVDIPVVAIGGIGASNAAAVLATGCRGVAVIRAVLSSAEPTATAAALTKPSSAS
jgi:thiamine-phosphate pyrophosphorylase